MPAWSRVNSGLLLDLTKPDASKIRIRDIAFHLSKLCRYSGATKYFYSVAEHSVNVSVLAEKMGASAKAGLLHDAAEAFLNDINGNLKKQPGMSWYRELEEEWLKVIFEKFKVPFSEMEGVGAADKIMLEIEGKELVKGWEYSTVINPEYLKIPVRCFWPSEAFDIFECRFSELFD